MEEEHTSFFYKNYSTSAHVIGQKLDGKHIPGEAEMACLCPGGNNASEIVSVKYPSQHLPLLNSFCYSKMVS